MTPLLIEFESRVKELSSYFSFIEILERESALLSLPKKRTWKNRKIDEKVIRILKANFFLLLYNLVEASMRDGFLSIYRAVESDGCLLSDLTPALRRLWVDAEFNRVQPNSANHRGYRELARRLVDRFATNAEARLDSTALRFGGNLDAETVREACAAHGVSHRTHPRTRGGEKLDVIKRKRNALAHGQLSFVECGRDYSVAELATISNQTIHYLRGILKNIDRFTVRRNYRAAPKSA